MAFTEFDADHRYHHQFMAGVRCVSGETQLAAIMAQALTHKDVRAFVYVGDHLEDEQQDLIDLAGRFAERGIAILVLHDYTGEGVFDVRGCYKAAPIFNAMARITKGAVLPFDPSSLPWVREMLSAIAVFAAEGRPGLAAKRTKLKAADDLLRLLPP